MARTYTPKVVFPEWVLHAIVDECLRYPDTETGQAMFGISTPDRMIVVGVIPQLFGGTRQATLFQNGGNNQDDIFNWYKLHWERERQLSRLLLAADPNMAVPIPPSFDQPLTYLGDWHKHPGEMRSLSGQDMQELRSLLLTPNYGLQQLLAPIFTHARQYTASFATEQTGITGVLGQAFHLDVHYISPVNNNRDVQAVKVPAEIWDDGYVPALPPLPWHLTNPQRLESEVTKLRNAGYQVKWSPRRLENEAHFRLAFGIDHPTWTHRLIVYTNWDHPRSDMMCEILVKREFAHLYPAEVTPDTHYPQPPAANHSRGFLPWSRRRKSAPINSAVKTVPNSQLMVASAKRFFWITELVSNLERHHMLPTTPPPEVEVIPPPAQPAPADNPEVTGRQKSEPALPSVSPTREQGETRLNYEQTEPVAEPESHPGGNDENFIDHTSQVIRVISKENPDGTDFMEPGEQQHWYPSG